jgi:hypothetical protein
VLTSQFKWSGNGVQRLANHTDSIDISETFIGSSLDMTDSVGIDLHDS